MQEQYQDFRQWYFQVHTSDQLQDYKNQYYQYLQEIQSLISFPYWVSNLKSHSEQNLNVLTAFRKDWITTDGQIIQSVHPPSQSLSLAPDNKDNPPLLISPFGEISENTTTNVKQLIQVTKQNNYTNFFL